MITERQTYKGLTLDIIDNGASGFVGGFRVERGVI